ncbi:MAG: hypothetical protein COT71_01045 [Candidatus Andersenbacteria bacterium CG10_big_fil_rev_8_21_14_0_10_54_11]|uniref:Transcription regulator TrmB N-terminal domain-containing protein n=1 Tax=Candidatus Andersenbacteria bacterium CG10_big_fil_rev_8_21_14_0_10_54_11 TaxID=1974485 RepID=A0A2M6WZV7_9BACT|nr:MAG: hypothetical protein COT71_01045 [Candidatus Andersenbacteria bacterium CG10_big_fil_rev_8_21_14_0_10_54_11]
MVFEKELKKLGLKEKEAAVYLACLQLGPGPVQQISRKAKVVRATTYVVLESLMAQGLVTKYKEGKKTLFSAEPPRQLMRLLEKQREVIDEQQHALKLLLPELQVLMKSAAGRPTVRYFNGVEGLRAIRREMMMYSEPGDVWLSFTPVDHLDALLGGERDSYYRQRVAKNIKSKSIFSTRSQRFKSELLDGADALSELRFLSSDLFPSTSGMTIYRNRIAIGTFIDKVGGVIIESSPMADMMRRLFELAWAGAETLEAVRKRQGIHVNAS